jgi:outer membrane protein OmpA-like peptidoglycan-associated protein
MIQRLLLFCFVLLGKVSSAQDSSVVYFDFDKYELTSEARATLQKVISKPNLFSAVIYGHTDQLGSNNYNDKLSLKRAFSVRDFLIANGIDEAKIKVIQGFGEAMPAINSLDEVSRRSNRRVVIITQFEVTSTDSVVLEETPKAEPPKVETTKPKPPVNNTPVRKTVKEDLIKEVTDSTTREGDNIILPNINFFGGRHVFIPQSYAALEELLFVMNSVPTLVIEIQGHICCQEGEGDGLDIDTGEPFLSYNRARAVYEYLLEKGIDRKRMTYKGYGHKYPIIEFERTESERTTNRRVEIKIIKK